jgi:hypothetical protein
MSVVSGTLHGDEIRLTFEWDSGDRITATFSLKEAGQLAECIMHAVNEAERLKKEAGPK